MTPNNFNSTQRPNTFKKCNRYNIRYDLRIFTRIFSACNRQKNKNIQKKNQYTYKKECSLDRWRVRKGVTGVTWSVLTMLDQMEAIFVLKHLYVREILEIFVKMYWKKPCVRKKIVSFWLQRKRKILTAKKYHGGCVSVGDENRSVFQVISVLKRLYVWEVLEILVKMYWKTLVWAKKFCFVWLTRKRELLKVLV